jgi:predicted nucleic acid-binding protein
LILVADTGALYALYDAEDRHHETVKAALEAHRGPVVVPSAILSEVDYLLREFLGVQAELDFIASLRSGAFQLAELTPADLDRCSELLDRYRDLDLGLADTAVMATAERLGTLEILTVDERDFRAVVSRNGKPFVLLPADAPRRD